MLARAARGAAEALSRRARGSRAFGARFTMVLAKELAQIKARTRLRLRNAPVFLSSAHTQLETRSLLQCPLGARSGLRDFGHSHNLMTA